MDDLVKEFITETVDSLSRLDLDLVQLEKEPENAELLGNIFRLMHTIKGTCGFIGLPRLEKTAHAAENLLDCFRNGRAVSEMSMTILFMCIDRVRFLVSEISKTNKEPEGSDADIIDLIEKEIAQTSASPAPSAPVAEMAADDSAPASLPSSVPTTSMPSAPAPTESAAEKNPEYLRVQMKVLEDLINMVSELVLTRNQLLQLVRVEDGSSLKAPFQRLNRIVSDLQDNVMKTRMQPIGNAWSKLPRIVRDLSTETKKKIVLEMEGEETELDRQVLEQIKDPLTHMVRNSCDHGIEMPEDRVASGKRDTGTIKLKAYHEGGFVIIRITDDGKGLDASRIANKAVELGLIDADKVSQLSEKQILSFIMRPGFSTAQKVTNISGRGVGMDVVRANIEKIGGSIDMESVAGKGTVFTIQIPLTLAIISALIVEIQGRRYAIPQMNIQELVSLGHADSAQVEYINDKPVLRLRERIIPLLDSASLFQAKPDEATEKDFTGKLIAVISTGTSYYGIILDRMYDIEEVVIKSVSSVLRRANIFAGNTILGDGQVIMILDPAAIARKFSIERAVSQLESETARQNAALESREKAAMLIFKAHGDAYRAVPLALISRIHVFPAADVTCSGGRVVVKYNGRLMQLFTMDEQAVVKGGQDITALVLSDDRSEAAMGLIIDHIVDIMEGDLDLAAATMRSGVLGSMIIGDYTADVVDISYFLTQNSSDWFSVQRHATMPFIADHLNRVHESGGAGITPSPTPSVRAPANDGTGAASSRTAPSSGRPRLLLVDDSPFFRSMLYPLLTGAGYDVTLSEDPLQAIRLHDEGRMFDVILSDIEMPGMDGYQFVEKMRDQSAWKSIPFIAITSHNTREDVEYGYKMGFDKYIGKFDKDELIRSLDSVRAGRAA